VDKCIVDWAGENDWSSFCVLLSYSNRIILNYYNSINDWFINYLTYNKDLPTYEKKARTSSHFTHHQKLGELPGPTSGHDE